ncbi:MAG: ABC transporter permease [Eubacterium sp.]|nr:ABC transporter permease [Eubacterium sp.]
MMAQTWKMAWTAVFSNKLRTFLTMLGIIIGVAALVILVSIANGATNSVSDSISSIGSNYLMVRISDDKDQPLRLSEFQKLIQGDSIDATSPVGRSSVTAKSGYTSESMNLYGITGGYIDIMHLELTSGRNMKMTDVDNSSYVIIITADTAVEFFGHSNVVGEEISLDGRAFQIIGVVEKSDSTTSMSNMMNNSGDEESVTLEGYIPYSTLTRMGSNSLDISMFYVASSNEESMEQTEMEVEKILLERFENDEDAFTVVNQSEVMEAMGEVKNTLTMMLGGIAAISLLVGGIGIMNIMLVSVTERTREIGIRKAIGAGRGTIMTQFLIESVIVSLLGCAIGILFSWGTLKVIAKVMAEKMTLQMDMNVVWIAVLFSAVIGVVFGMYPANKASKMKPIDALRYTG